MKGVLMMVNEFPPLTVGGAERQAESLSVHFAHRGLWVGVLTRKIGTLPAMEQRDGFSVMRVPQWGPGKFKSLTFTLGAIITIFKQRNNFDILHAHLAFAPAVAAAIAGKLFGKKVIVKFGNSGSFGDIQVSRLTFRGRFALQILRTWSDVCIALSDEMQKEMLNAGFLENRVVRMVNGADALRFTPSIDKVSDKKKFQLEEKTVLLFTGRLVAQKALNVLLQAFSLSKKSIADLHLVIVGDGEERLLLEQMAIDLGIRDDVTFIKWVQDIYPYLKGADIFILPSLVEGISNSLLEAMATGLACISTRVGGSEETLGNGEYGILVDPNREDQLSSAITMLAENKKQALSLGVRARQRILDYYDFSVVCDRYFSLYKKLLEEK